MLGLSKRECTPCKKGSKPLNGENIKPLFNILSEWNLSGEHHIEKNFSFSDFRSALNFVDKVGDIAENEGHHPDIMLKWGFVRITLFTHNINGLHENDFIMAAKIDEIYRGGTNHE